MEAATAIVVRRLRYVLQGMGVTGRPARSQ